jgi:hypothetical protein
VKFKTDSDRRAWRDYAAAALSSIDLGTVGAEGAVPEAVKAADLMLREEQKRRSG